MAFIQYFSYATSESLVDSYLNLLTDYGMMIPHDFKQSKQLYAEFKSKDNKSLPKVNLLISWVDISQKKCSIEIWSDEPFSRKKTLCKKVHDEITKLITPKELGSNKIVKVNKNL